MKKVYVVQKYAVYLHGVFGVFDDYKDAMELAKTLKLNDHDNHHDYIVTQINLNDPSIPEKDNDCCKNYKNVGIRVFDTNDK